MASFKKPTKNKTHIENSIEGEIRDLVWTVCEPTLWGKKAGNEFEGSLDYGRINKRLAFDLNGP